MTRALWKVSSWSLDLSCIPIVSSANWIQFLLNANVQFGIRDSCLPSFLLFAALSIDVVWFAHNKVVHEGKVVVIYELQLSLARRYSEHQAAWSLCKPSVFAT